MTLDDAIELMRKGTTGAMKKEEIEGLIGFINGEKIDSFSGLIAALNLAPGIHTIKFMDDQSDTFQLLVTMFDSSDIAGPQSIELEVVFLRSYCETHDYEVGFHLNGKWYQLGYGWFSEFVKELNKRAAAASIQAIGRRILVPPTSISANATVS